MPSDPLGRFSRLIFLLGAVLTAGCSSGDDDSPTPADHSLEPADSYLMALSAPYDGQVVLSDTLDLLIHLSPEADTSTLRVTLDGIPIDAALLIDAQGQVRGEDLPHSPGDHAIEATVRSHAGLEQRLSVGYTARPGGALAKRIDHPDDLIGGPASQGRPGDILLQNDRVQFVIQDVGRYGFALSAFGGNVIDADRVRKPWEAERDVIGALAPSINIEATSNPTSVRVIGDGSTGGPAMIEVAGPDDLLQTFNISSIVPFFTPNLITAVPATADDKDLPVEVKNRYILERGASWLTWETTVQNQGATALSMYAGDYLNVTGDVEAFSPGEGFGAVTNRDSCDFLAWIHRDETEAFGYIPEVWEGSSVMSFQGISISLFGQNATQVLLGKSPPAFKIAPGETLTLRRWLVLGRDIGDVVDARAQLLERDAGVVGGVVTQASLPVPGARIAALRTNRATGAAEVIAHWTSDGQGRWGGLLEPGSYTLMAGLEAAANPSGTTGAPSYRIDVAPGQVVPNLDFSFTLPAAFRVIVTDENGAPVPAKVTVVGFDPSPDPALADPSLDGAVHGVLSDPDRDPSPFGIAKVALADVLGDTGPIAIEPGDYTVVVSRGPEYSRFVAPISLRAAQPELLLARVARVVDTRGFAAGDFHVHSIDSFDAFVPRDRRVLSLLAEGLDMFAATDHTIRIDYNDLLADLGASDLLAAFVGEEITTYDIGHYNVWPTLPVPELVTRGAIDNAVEAPPGQAFPVYGAFDLSPSELAAAALAEPGPQVFQLNHPNNSRNGYFSMVGIDTATTPPRSVVPASVLRQDPTLTNLFDEGWTAMEIWRGFHDSWDLIFDENLGDWFNLLNQGIVRTITSNSDTHGTIEVPVGGPRNYVGMGDLTGVALAQSSGPLATAMNEGRVICSNAPFVTVDVLTAGGAASHRPGTPLITTALDGRARVLVSVQSPIWAPFDEISLFINNAPFPMPDTDDAPGTSSYQGVDLSAADVPRYQVSPDIRLDRDVDFDVEQVQLFPAWPDAARLEAEVMIELEDLTEDTWIVVVVRGREGLSGPLFPVIPAGLDPSSNVTLDDLMDGNVGQGGVLAMAITNPLFIDVDGNRAYDAPGVRLSAPPPVADDDPAEKGRY